MARRATYFFDVHKTSVPRILVSGAWEYMRPGSQPIASKILASISEAMDLMSYDVGLLSKEEADILMHLGVAPPPWQQTASNAPFSIFTTNTGDRVGFLRFPSLPSDRTTPQQETLERLVRDIRKYRAEVRLLVGLSDWGWLAEQEFLNQSEAVPDVLLGSGQGAGVNGRLLADGRCIWVRAYDKGRSIAEITIIKWPDRENSFAWNPTRNYKTSSIGLDDKIKDYPSVRDVLE